MAEIFGVITGTVTLGALIGKISKFVSIYKDNKNQLNRYCTTLQMITNSHNMINNLIKDSKSIGAISVTIKEEEVNVVHFCLQVVEDIEKDANNFLQILKNAQSKESLIFLGNLISRLRSFRTKIRSTIEESYLDKLIETAKNAQNSLHVALTALIFSDIGISARNFGEALNSMNKKLQGLRGDVQSTTRVVVRFKCKKPLPRIKSDRRKGKGRMKDCDSLRVESSLADGKSTVEASTNRSASNILSEGVDAVCSTEIEDDIAVMHHDGRLVMVPDSPLREEPSTTGLEPAPEHKSDTEDTELPSELEDDHSDDDVYLSDFRNQPPVSFCESSMELSPDGAVFIDGAVTIADCKTSRTGLLRFCARTLIAGENYTNAILQEPCGIDPDVCCHVSVYSEQHSLFEKQSPYSFQGILKHRSYFDTDARTRGHGDLESLALNFLDDCDNPKLHTLIYRNKGTHKRYASPTKLAITSFRSLESLVGVDMDEDRAHEEGQDMIGADRDVSNEDSEVPTGDVTGHGAVITHGIGPFTRVPCIFCGTDALQPAKDATVSFGTMVYRNFSFGYTCQRCKKRSWVSRGEYRLSVLGVDWSWWG